MMLSSCERCGMEFSLFIRRHHCRNCGGIFCSVCVENQAALFKFGYVSPVPVCANCHVVLNRTRELVDSVYRNELMHVKEMIKDRRTNVNMYQWLYPPLFTAARCGHVQMAKLLLSLGARIGFRLPPSTTFATECRWCASFSIMSKEPQRSSAS